MIILTSTTKERLHIVKTRKIIHCSYEPDFQEIKTTKKKTLLTFTFDFEPRSFLPYAIYNITEHIGLCVGTLETLPSFTLDILREGAVKVSNLSHHG